jgi:EAL domain-containing protein (putative c-di-GMP-specific phosphodiesterase class I)
VSKRSGRNLVSYFSADGNHQRVRLAKQLTLLSELHHAYPRNEFFLEYQPVFDSFDGRVVAVEALIRWHKPNGEIVPPDLFIPIAEQSRLTEWRSCRRSRITSIVNIQCSRSPGRSSTY